MSKDLLPKLKTHGVAIITVAIVITFLSASSLLTADVSNQADMIVTEIGIEHLLPLSMAIDLSSLEGVGLIDVTNQGDELVYISLPSNWQRREVRYVPLKSVISESSSFGFTRWQFPSKASVSFRIPQDPDSFIVHNPSEVPVKVTLTRVSLDTNSVIRDVILIQDSSQQLW